MKGKRKQGIYVSVYIPAELIDSWKSIKEKSKFVQEAITDGSRERKQ